MSTETRTITMGPGLPTLLTVLFVALKLTGHIDWSWWWVFSPLWIVAALVLGIVILAFLILIVIALVKAVTS